MDVVGRRAGEQLGQQGPGLSDPAALLEPAPDPAHDPQAQARLVVGEGPVGRGAQVAVLPIEAPHVGLAGRAEDRAPGALGDLHADMDEAGLQLLAFSALGEPLERVFAQDRMEAEARLDLLDRGAVRAVRAGGADLDPDEALVGERLEAGQHVDSEITVWIRHGPGGVRGPAAGEHGKPGEQPAFFRGEQVVAPRDGAA